MGYDLKDTLIEARWYAKTINEWDPALTRAGVYYNDATSLLNLIRDLKDKLKELSFYGVEKRLDDFVNIRSLKVAGNYKEIVSKYSDYPLWACDFNGYCLVGNDLDKIESIDRIEQNVIRDEHIKHLEDILKTRGKI